MWKAHGVDVADEGRMELGILVTDENKFLRIEVKPSHTVGSVVETIRHQLKMSSGKEYYLGLRGEYFGREQYRMTIRSIGARDGEHLTLNSSGMAGEVEFSQEDAKVEFPETESGPKVESETLDIDVA